MGPHKLVQNGQEHVERPGQHLSEPGPRFRQTILLDNGQIIDLCSLERDPESNEDPQPVAPQRQAINDEAIQPKRPGKETAAASTTVEERAPSSSPQTPAPEIPRQSTKRKAGENSTALLPMVAPASGPKKPRRVSQNQWANLEATVAEIRASETGDNYDAPGQLDEEYARPKKGEYRVSSLPHLPGFAPRWKRTADDLKTTTSNKRRRTEMAMTEMSGRRLSVSARSSPAVDITDTLASVETTPAMSVTSFVSSNQSMNRASSSSSSMPTDDDTQGLHERVIQRYTKNREMEMPTFQERLGLMTVKEREVEEKKLSNMTDAMRMQHIREDDEKYWSQWKRYVAQFSGMTEEVASMRDNEKNGKAAREAYLKERDEKRLREELLKIAGTEKKARREEERAQKARAKQERQRELAVADHAMPELPLAAPQLAPTIAGNPYMQPAPQQQMGYAHAGRRQPVPMMPGRPHPRPAPRLQMAYPHPGRPQMLPYQPYQNDYSTVPPQMRQGTYQQSTTMMYSHGVQQYPQQQHPQQQHPQQQHGTQYGMHTLNPPQLALAYHQRATMPANNAPARPQQHTPGYSRDWTADMDAALYRDVMDFDVMSHVTLPDGF